MDKRLKLAISSNLKLKKTWSQWVGTSQKTSAVETLTFLSAALGRLPPSRQNFVLAKIEKADNSFLAEATLHELVAHEFLYRLTLQPEWEPHVGNLTPDLAFTTQQGIRFLTDVFVAHSPKHSVNGGLASYLKDDTLKDGWAYDSPNDPYINRTKKVAERVQEKVVKYNSTGMPLLVFGFLGDNRAFDFRNFEQALYGSTVSEAAPYEPLPLPAHQRVNGGGLLVPQEDVVPFRNLSAVIACEWFDTLDRTRPGKRLAAVVLHHWSAKIPLPENAFGSFPQVVWPMPPPSVPKVRGTPNLVCRFAEDGTLELRPYTGDLPW
jgi:hypothetical protein